MSINFLEISVRSRAGYDIMGAVLMSRRPDLQARVLEQLAWLKIEFRATYDAFDLCMLLGASSDVVQRREFVFVCMERVRVCCVCVCLWVSACIVLIVCTCISENADVGSQCRAWKSPLPTQRTHHVMAMAGKCTTLVMLALIRNKEGETERGEKRTLLAVCSGERAQQCLEASFRRWRFRKLGWRQERSD